jgi:homoserine O-acetyltransferase
VPHIPLGPEHVDAPHRLWQAGDFPLESGGVVRDLELSWVEHGVDDPTGARTIVGLTAIGATHHRLDFLIGPERALDTSRWRVIVIDALGNGLTTAPSTSRTQPGPDFPSFTIRDMVATQHLLLTRHLGLSQVHAVIGASMGGMQAVQWGVSHPGFMRRIVAMTPMARTHPWSRIMNEAARRALTNDPAFAGGRYGAQPERGWRDWAVIMRGLTARTPQAVAAEQDFELWFARIQDTMVPTGIDANDWLAQSRAYDAHDVGTTPGFGGDTRAALAAVRAATLVLVPPLDLYNPVEAAREVAQFIPRARLVEIPSSFGHHSANQQDPGAVAFLNREIGAFLAEE